MKVLHIESGRHLYGGALQVALLIEGLMQRGVESHLACTLGAGIGAAARPHAAGVHEIPMKGDVDLTTLWRLRRLIRQLEPDLVHLHSRFGTDIWGALAARAEGVAVVFSRRVDNREPPLWVRLKYRLYDQVVAISEGIRAVLIDEGLSPDHVVCVHSAVDTERYRPGCTSRAWLQAEFGLQPDELTLALIAQFIPRKGHRTLIDALPAVLAEQPRTRVLLFGQGPELEPVRRLVQARGLQDRVVFAGFRGDLARVLPCIDLLVHPAATEGLGVVLLQASACGVPIVASRTGGIPEIVRHAQTGELVPPGDVPALAAALRRLLGDADLRRRCGAAARRLVEAEFSTAAMVAGNHAVYEEVLSRRAARRRDAN